MCAALLPAAAFAQQQWRFEAGASSQVTYTSNSNYESGAARASDVILELAPRFALRGEGRRFRLRGELEIAGVTYLEGTRNDRLLPRANIDGSLEAIEDFFFIDAGVVTAQTREDPFKARADSGSSFNTVNTTRYQLTPRAQGRLGSYTSYEVRSSNSWVDSDDDTGTDSVAGAYVGQQTLTLTRRPVPLGYSVQAVRDETRFDSGQPRAIVTESARLIVSLAVNEQLQLSARGGYLNYKFLATDNEGELWGGGLVWQPSPRTKLDGFYEQRFFGKGWNLGFSHRMPRLQWTFGLQRDLTTFPSSLTLPGQRVTAEVLDAILTTRYPDPVERARRVQETIAANGLPATLQGTFVLYAQSVQLVNSKNAAVTFLGARNVLSLGGFLRRTEVVRGAGFATAASDTREDGATLSLGTQVSSLSSVTTAYSWTRTRGLGTATGRAVEQNSIRLQWNRRLSPDASGFIGARYQMIDTTTAGVTTEGEEVGAFLGLSIRF